MSRRASRHTVRSASCVFLALAASVLVAPTKAIAGCSHYVTASGAIRSDLSATATMTGLAPALPAAPEQRPRPCAGPTCSGRPMPLTTAPAVSITVRGEHQGCLFAPPTLDGPGSRLWTLAGPPLRGVANPRAIDRPPRPSSLPLA